MFGQTDKYYGREYKKYLFVDEGSYEVPDGWECVYYDDSLPYNERVASCLRQLPSEGVVIFHHEDMFLFDVPMHEIMAPFYEKISNEKVDFIKLCKASYDPNYNFFKHSENLYYTPADLLFAIQPTMCKVKNLRTVYEQTPAQTGWQLEKDAPLTCMRNSFICCSSNIAPERKIGLYHWESLVYPYFMTAIVKGKWNFLEYPNKLGQVLEEHKVDYGTRGNNL